MASVTPRISKLDVAAYRVPTDKPESDGTLSWDATTIVLVRVEAGGQTGTGFTYAHRSAALLIRDILAGIVEGEDAFATFALWRRQQAALRNLGPQGLASMAVAAVDIALWDLKARILDLPLVNLFGMTRPGVPVYGSGGFTSYDTDYLREQLGGWAAQGMQSVKMKIGRQPEADFGRIRAAREAIGPDVALMVDANGALTDKQALTLARWMADAGVIWFEEPVSSQNLAGLRLVRERAPAEIDIAAGEYGYDSVYFRRMLDAGAVDVLQVDATRSCGITGFLDAVALSRAYGVPVSAHCAPAVHLHPAAACPEVRHIEYFHDHARIEHMLFEGAARPENGILHPDPSRPGHGLRFLDSEAERYAL